LWQEVGMDRVLDAAEHLLNEMQTLVLEHRVLHVHTTPEEHEKQGNQLRKLYAICGIEEDYFLSKVVKSETFLADAERDANWERRDAEDLLKHIFNDVSHVHNHNM
jgi:hypothetical protein